MQNMTLTVGSWDNVREGGNMISVKTRLLALITSYVKYGRYTHLVTFVHAINQALDVEHFKYVHKTQTDDEGESLVPYMGCGGRFELTAAVAEKPGTPAIQAPDSLCIYDKAGNCIPVITQEAGPPTPAEPPYLKFIHDKVKISDTAVTFYKKIAYLLGVIPTITSPVPAIKDGWKIEQSKIDLTRNNLTLLWVFPDFITPTTCTNKL